MEKSPRSTPAVDEVRLKRYNNGKRGGKGEEDKKNIKRRKNFRRISWVYRFGPVFQSTKLPN